MTTEPVTLDAMIEFHNARLNEATSRKESSPSTFQERFANEAAIYKTTITLLQSMKDAKVTPPEEWASDYLEAHKVPYRPTLTDDYLEKQKPLLAKYIGVIQHQAIAATLAQHKQQEDEFDALSKKLWIEAKPSYEAQAIRASIEFDSGTKQYPEGYVVPDYVWRLVDIAIQKTLVQAHPYSYESVAEIIKDFLPEWDGEGHIELDYGNLQAFAARVSKLAAQPAQWNESNRVGAIIDEASDVPERAWNTRAEPAPPVLDWPEELSSDVWAAGYASINCRGSLKEAVNDMREAHAKTKGRV